MYALLGKQGDSTKEIERLIDQVNRLDNYKLYI